MNNVMSLGIYFEITDAELYGGKDSIGYAATIVVYRKWTLLNMPTDKEKRQQACARFHWRM